MSIAKNDFIELEFTARIKETGEIFDTTNLDDAKKSGLIKGRKEEDFKPIKICVGQGMVVKGLDNALNGKEIGGEYEIELKPKEAFGERNPALVRTVPLSVFHQKGVEPVAGAMLNIDNMLVRISAVTSGRVIADFNNPLAGKGISYKFKIVKKIEDLKERVEVLANFFLGKSDVTLEGNKATLEAEILLPEGFLEEFKKKVKDILNIDVEIREKEEKKQKKEQKGKQEEGDDKENKAKVQ